MEISFEHDYSDTNRHLCESEMKGDWVVFTCPKCRGYEKRYNLKTEEMRVKGNEDFDIFHDGQYFPPEMQDMPERSLN